MSKTKVVVLVIVGMLLSIGISAFVTIQYTKNMKTKVSTLEDKTLMLETNTSGIRMNKLWEDYSGSVDSAGTRLQLNDNISNYDLLLVYYIDGYGILEKKVIDGVTYYNNSTSQAGTNQNSDKLYVWNQYILLEKTNEMELTLRASGLYFESDVSDAIGVRYNSGDLGDVKFSSSSSNYATRPVWAIYGIKFNN